MYFKFKCPHCEKSLKVREELAGRKCACPYCKGSVRIPQSIATEPTEAAAPKPGFPGIETAGAPKGKGGKPTAKDDKPDAPSKPAPSQPMATSTHAGAADSTDVSLVRSGLIGAVLSVAFYSLLFLLWMLWSGAQGSTENKADGEADKYAIAAPAAEPEAAKSEKPPLLIGLFCCRGFVPYVLVLLTNWSFAILFLKSRKIARQKASVMLDVLPTELSEEITLDSLDKFAGHIHDLPAEAGESFLVNRVIRGLQHFRVRKSAAETVTMMESQSEIDANNVASSYTIVKVFIWALPIMGFIGTVIGVSGAVAGLSGSLETSSDISAVKDSLKDVFGNLGVAFDTTLLALVLSLFVKIPTSAMQKSEEDVVTWVDEYCNENLLRRLNDGRDGGARSGAAGIDTGAFREAVETAMAAHQAELESWAKKLEAIGLKVTSQVTEGWKEINTQVQSQMAEHGTQLLQQQEQNAEQLLKEYEQRLDELRQQRDEVDGERKGQQEEWNSQMSEMSRLASEIQEVLAGLGDRAQSIQSDMAESINGTGQALQDHFAGLERGLSSLSGVLEQLGEKQVVVQQVEKPRKGWFSRRGDGRRRR